MILSQNYLIKVVYETSYFVHPSSVLHYVNFTVLQGDTMNMFSQHPEQIFTSVYLIPFLDLKPFRL